MYSNLSALWRAPVQQIFSRALHYSVPHNHIVVLWRWIPKIIIINYCTCSGTQRFQNSHLQQHGADASHESNEVSRLDSGYLGYPTAVLIGICTLTCNFVTRGIKSVYVRRSGKLCTMLVLALLSSRVLFQCAKRKTRSIWKNFLKYFWGSCRHRCPDMRLATSMQRLSGFKGGPETTVRSFEAVRRVGKLRAKVLKKEEIKNNVG